MVTYIYYIPHSLTSHSFVLSTDIRCHPPPSGNSQENPPASQMQLLLKRIFYFTEQSSTVYSPLPLGMSTNCSPSPLMNIVRELMTGFWRAGEQNQCPEEKAHMQL